MTQPFTRKEQTETPTRKQQPRRKVRWSAIAIHGGLLTYTLIALGPIILIVVNSFKSRKAIFGSPFSLPTAETFSMEGYNSVFSDASFLTYFRNSFIVTVATIAIVLLLASMAAFALVEYKFRGNLVVALYFTIGIMIPLRLGTVSLLNIMVKLNLVDTLWALIVTYTAMGIPLGVFLMTQFMRQVPVDIKNSARVDGASEYRVYLMTLPLARAGLAAVAAFTMLPVWNDLWFPLIFAPSEGTKTITLGAQQFMGQYSSDWNAVLAALTIAIVPVVILYAVFSKQFLSGLTEGAVK